MKIEHILSKYNMYSPSVTYTFYRKYQRIDEYSLMSFYRLQGQFANLRLSKLNAYSRHSTSMNLLMNIA